MTLVEGQKVWNVVESGWIHMMRTGRMSKDIFTCDDMFRGLKDIHVAEAVIEVSNTPKEQKSMLVVDGVIDRVLHEGCGNTFVSVIWVGSNFANAADV